MEVSPTTGECACIMYGQVDTRRHFSAALPYRLQKNSDLRRQGKLLVTAGGVEFTQRRMIESGQAEVIMP